MKQYKNILLLIINNIILFSFTFYILKSWNYQTINMINIQEYLKKYGELPFIILFFITIGIIINYLIISSNIKKHTILYLETYKDNNSIFINKKGKIIVYTKRNVSLKEGKFYEVELEDKQIKKIIKVSNEIFKIKKKKIYYWRNIYLLNKYHENIMLLPVFYIMLIIFIMNALINNNARILFIILSIIPLIIIILDLIYKIKLSNDIEPNINEFNNLVYVYDKFNNDIKFKNKINKILSYIKISIISLLLLLILYMFFRLDRSIYIILIILLLILIVLLLKEIFIIKNNDKMLNILYKSCSMIFFMYLFGFLIFSSIIIIKEKAYIMLLFIIPFLIAGILIIKDEFFKK